MLPLIILNISVKSGNIKDGKNVKNYLQKFLSYVLHYYLFLNFGF